MALLICIECGETSEDGEGWKRELAVDLLDEEEPDGGSLRACHLTGASVLLEPVNGGV